MSHSAMKEHARKQRKEGIKRGDTADGCPQVARLA